MAVGYATLDPISIPDEADVAPAARAGARHRDAAILQMLGTAMENGADGIVVGVGDAGGQDLRIVHANPAFEALAGTPESSLAGRDLLRVARTLVDDAAADRAVDAVRRRVPLSIDATVRNRPGRTYELRAFPAAGPDELLTEWVWSLHDITARVRRELHRKAGLRGALRRQERRLGELREELRVARQLAPLATMAGGLGHDMNNLLLPMRAHLESLATCLRDERATEHIAALHSVLEYLQHLTDSLRLIAIDPGGSLAADRRTRLAPWWKGTERLLTAIIRPGVRLDVDLPPDLPAVRVAPQLLTLAVLNLVVNASEAVRRGGGIGIRARPSEDGASVRIVVSDDGCGMPPEVRQRAFDPFFTTKDRCHATGLGLALVHSVAKGAGGQVQIDSRVGHGTRVTVALPAAQQRSGGAGTRRIGVVRVRDVRVATLLRALLKASGVTVSEDTSSCSVLVSEASLPALEEARALRARCADAQVFVYGEPTADWRRLGAVVIRRGAGPGTIRQALSRLLLVSEGSCEHD